MSEQKVSFMQALDAWIDGNVIAPLCFQSEDENSEEASEDTMEGVKKAIKNKVLQSYHNGVAVGRRQGPQEEQREFSRPPRAGGSAREFASSAVKQRRPVYQR